MKRIIYLFTILALVGCSSSGSKDETKAEMSEVNSIDDVSLESEPVEAPKAKEAPQKAMGGQTPLSQAIKSGSDERIFQVSTEMLTKNSNDVVALNALAMYHFKKGRLDLSKYLLNKAIGANANTSALYTNLGVVQMSQGESREAIQSFKKAIQLNPNEVTAASNLGAIYIKERDFSKAAIALGTAQRSGLKDPKFLLNYGILQTSQGNYPEAKKAYEQALKGMPDSKEAMLNLSILLIDHMKKYEEGLQVLGGLKFVGGPDDSRNLIIALENKALSGLNQQ